jgi:hypothetical protein
MTPHHDLIIGFAKPISALAVAGFTYIAESVTPSIPGVPSWLTSLGLPVAFLLAVIYALIATHKALRASEDGRRGDWEKFAEKLEDIGSRGNETRERLIRATDAQTHEFAKLADHLKSRPCQKD